MASKELLAIQCCSGNLTRRALKVYLFEQNKGLSSTLQQVKSKLDHIDKKIQLIDIMTDSGNTFSNEIKERSKLLMNELISAENRSDKEHVMDKIVSFIDSLKS